MNRILFEKTGNAVWMSHLDLMRLFQRAFKRAGLHLKHTQGFSPRAIVSIALPMSVGVESVCEILDYELDGQSFSHYEIVARLNDAVPAGIRIIESYESDRKIKHIAYLDCQIRYEYDRDISPDIVEQINELFRQSSLMVEKRGKNGPVQQDMIPMIRQFNAVWEDRNHIRLDSRICAQNPSLNPTLFLSALERYLPDAAADHALIRRIEVLDTEGNPFR